MRVILLSEGKYHMLLTILKAVLQARDTIFAYYAKKLLNVLEKGEEKR